MANSGKHILFGFAVSAGLRYFTKKANNEPVTIGELIGIGLIGSGFALLPDILEPATNPHHRSLMHSLLIAWITINTKPTENQEFWNTAKSGYLSHLLLDACTPASLPLV